MKHEVLLRVAKDLGIENAESLSYSKLRKAVSEKKKSIGAEGLVSEKNDTDDLESDVAEDNDITENEALESIIEPSLEPVKVVEKDGVIDIESKEGDDQETNKDNEQDTPPNPWYEDPDGRRFTFTNDCPARFRYNNRIKSKEEWLQDDDAMEQLILGNCSYVQQIFD